MDNKKPETALDKLLKIIRADAQKRQQEKALKEKHASQHPKGTKK